MLLWPHRVTLTSLCYFDLIVLLWPHRVTLTSLYCNQNVTHTLLYNTVTRMLHTLLYNSVTRMLHTLLYNSVTRMLHTLLYNTVTRMSHTLLYNTANKDIAKHQRVQNCLARVVALILLVCSRSMPFLKSLIALAPCALSHYFQDLHNSLSNTLIYTTSISKFDANSSKKFQTATLNQ